MNRSSKILISNSPCELQLKLTRSENQVDTMDRSKPDNASVNDSLTDSDESSSSFKQDKSLDGIKKFQYKYTWKGSILGPFGNSPAKALSEI